MVVVVASSGCAAIHVGSLFDEGRGSLVGTGGSTMGALGASRRGAVLAVSAGRSSYGFVVGVSWIVVLVGGVDGTVTVDAEVVVVGLVISAKGFFRRPLPNGTFFRFPIGFCADIRAI